MDEVVDKIDGVVDAVPQVDVKVRLKRSRGVKKDILKLLEGKKLSAEQVFEALGKSTFGSVRVILSSNPEFVNEDGVYGLKVVSLPNEIPREPVDQ